MKRMIQILAILLIIQLVVTVVVFWPQSTAQAVSGPLLPDFGVADVTSLVIRDDNDNRLVLARQGDAWVLPEAGDFPVDGEKVTALLNRLAELEASRLVTQTAASHKRLKVDSDDFNRLVEVALEDGLEYTLYLGSSAGAGATHVRVGDQPEVYLGQLNTFDTNAEASGWIDTLYHSVAGDDVMALTLENKNGTFEFLRDGDAWTMLGLDPDEAFDQNALTGLLNQATSVRMTAPLGQEEQASYQLAEPLAVVTLKTQAAGGETSHTLRLGAKIGDDGYAVKSSQSPYFVQVNELVAENFTEKTRDDFLQEPPAAAGEESATGEE
jgi:hypothetical protein